MNALGWIVFCVGAVPAAMLGAGIAHGLGWLYDRATGRPTEAEVMRRLMQLEYDRALREHHQQMRRT